MIIKVAKAHGMCFGVRDALRDTMHLAEQKPVTILGDLVHNPVALGKLRERGVRQADLAANPQSTTEDVIITAHGASDRAKKRWAESGRKVTDTTCPLVARAHSKLRSLVTEGRLPVIIGKPGHVEVEGLRGDFDGAIVIPDEAAITQLPESGSIGVISQTTQPISKVRALVEAMQLARPNLDIKFHDTVCQPTKDRQAALDDLIATCDVLIAVGGETSNNTNQLVLTAQRAGLKAWRVARAEELDATLFAGVRVVGVSAGTSTLDETVDEVVKRLKVITRQRASARAKAA